MQAVIVAKNLYGLFESLSPETQHHFLQQRCQEKGEELADLAFLTFLVACQPTHNEADFLSPEEAERFMESLPQ